jgi:hypothetical protein
MFLDLLRTGRAHIVYARERRGGTRKKLEPALPRENHF